MASHALASVGAIHTWKQAWDCLGEKFPNRVEDTDHAFVAMGHFRGGLSRLLLWIPARARGARCASPQNDGRGNQSHHILEKVNQIAVRRFLEWQLVAGFGWAKKATPARVVCAGVPTGERDPMKNFPP